MRSPPTVPIQSYPAASESATRSSPHRPAGPRDTPPPPPPDALPPARPDPIVPGGLRKRDLQLPPPLLRDSDDERAAGLPEQGGVPPSFTLALRHAFELSLWILDAEAPGERHLGDRDDLAAAGDVVRGVHEAGPDHLPHQVRGLFFGDEVRPGRPPGDAPVPDPPAPG